MNEVESIMAGTAIDGIADLLESACDDSDANTDDHVWNAIGTARDTIGKAFLESVAELIERSLPMTPNVVVEIADTDTSRQRWLEAIEFAIRHNCLCQLVRDVSYICNGSGREGPTKVVLGHDFAPLSFTFAKFVGLNNDGKLTMQMDEVASWKFMFNGGLIYEGPGQVCDGSAPTFTVSLGESRTVHSWGCHT